MNDDLEKIKNRNIKVESDKAWETSWTRRFIITVGTYVIVGLYLSYLSVAQSWLHALVPAMAYMLSTLSLPLVKTLWLKNIYLKDKSHEQ